MVKIEMMGETCRENVYQSERYVRIRKKEREKT